jgi:hypothetical protein
MVWQKREVASLQTGTTQKYECTGARTATGEWKKGQPLACPGLNEECAGTSDRKGIIFERRMKIGNDINRRR